ncbi:MAG: hypothetical protein ABMA64_28140, partial [Myxococcota bacterium]
VRDPLRRGHLPHHRRRTGKVLGPFPQLGPTWVRVGEGYLFATDHALVAATATGEVRWTVPALSRAYDGPVPP